MSVRRISCLAVVIVLVAVSCSDVSTSDANGLSSDGVVGGEQPPVVQGNSPGTLPEDGSDCGPLDISASQRRLGIQLELREGASACSISGSPDVELIGSFPGDRNHEGESCALVRTPEPVLPTELGHGAFAHSVLTFLVDPGGVVPDYIRVDLFGAGYGKTFRWQFGTVWCHNAATHPGTYIGAIKPGPVPND